RLAPSATQLFSGLEFKTDGSFNTTGSVISSSSPVDVGVAPATPGGAFTRLLSLTGGVHFDLTDTTGTFTTNAAVSGYNGRTATTLTSLLDAHSHPFRAPALLGTGFYNLASGDPTDTNGADLAVAGGNVAVTGLRFKAQELDVQGSLSLPNFAGL